MHELSLSCATVESVIESVAEPEATRMISITLLAGELSGVSIEAFRFSYPSAAAVTIIEDATFIIQNEPVTIFCCPICGQRSGVVRSGQDFTIQSVEIETNKELKDEHKDR